MYAQVFEWPADGALKVAVEGGRVKQAYLLADASHAPLQTEAAADGTVVRLPKEAVDPAVSVVVLELAS
jgi:hypothetical protein